MDVVERFLFRLVVGAESNIGVLRLQQRWPTARNAITLGSPPPVHQHLIIWCDLPSLWQNWTGSFLHSCDQPVRHTVVCGQQFRIFGWQRRGRCWGARAKLWKHFQRRSKFFWTEEHWHHPQGTGLLQPQLHKIHKASVKCPGRNTWFWFEFDHFCPSEWYLTSSSHQLASTLLFAIGICNFMYSISN